MARLAYLELPVADTGPGKAFYAAAFGWTFTDYGPTYAAADAAGIGMQADAAQQTAAPLPVIAVDDLDASFAAATAAGAAITQPIFAFPGGRRFHFRDPDGHELAAMQVA